MTIMRAAALSIILLSARLVFPQRKAVAFKRLLRQV
jgi:hypothetical protein